MCGIFGFAKKHDSQSDKQIDILRNVLTNLADESSVRGKDSTGFAVMTPNTRKTYKSLSDSSTLVNSEDWNSLLGDVGRNTTIVIGHVRLATHGTVNIRNAHPFTIGEVVGAHNGVIYNYNKIASSMGKEVQVDSEVIFASLNRNKMEDAFTDIDGDFAVTWVKDSNKVIHLAREDNRPMCIAYWKKAKVLFWASTDKIMKQALKRAGLKISTSGVVADKIFTFNTDKFTNEPFFEDVDFYSISQHSSYNYYGCTGSYNNSSTIKSTNTSNYIQGYDNYCVGCGDVEYKDEMCYTCWKDDNEYSTPEHRLNDQGQLVSSCEYCEEEYTASELKWTYDKFCYVCTSCINEGKVVKCGWCDEYVDEEDMTTSSGFGVCVDCKPHADNTLLGDNNVKEKSPTLRLTESCSI